MPTIFHAFIRLMRGSFHRIVKAARNEISVDDLHQDAWILADEIGKRRGRPIDFGAADDQQLILRAVNVKNVRRGDWKLRRAVRIDQDDQESEGSSNWAERIPAAASSDPLILLLFREADAVSQNLLEASYSQATAFVWVFVRFKSDYQDICAHLALSRYSLDRRVKVAGQIVRSQPSLFDGKERVGADFLPQAGRRQLLHPVQHPSVDQWVFAFE